MDSKIALFVGIDDYPHATLRGCVRDATTLEMAFSTNYDHQPNFSTQLITSEKTDVTRAELKKQLRNLFAHRYDVAAFFFAGHGMVNDLGGYLVTVDSHQYEEGVSMADVLTWANQSPSREVMIILDCCHSGAFGTLSNVPGSHVYLRDGVSVLCASSASQQAIEESGRGLFSALVAEALYGGAADLLGRVTIAGVYAFVAQNLKVWEQQPSFRCNVSSMTPVRVCDPKIDLSVLHDLITYFPAFDFEFRLDPSFEADDRARWSPENALAYKALWAYRAAGLLEPVGHPHMWHAAMNNGSVRLTKLGQYYWHTVQAKRI
jgi:hypothetical protein